MRVFMIYVAGLLWLSGRSKSVRMKPPLGRDFPANVTQWETVEEVVSNREMFWLKHMASLIDIQARRTFCPGVNCAPEHVSA